MQCNKKTVQNINIFEKLSQLSNKGNKIHKDNVDIESPGTGNEKCWGMNESKTYTFSNTNVRDWGVTM